MLAELFARGPVISAPVFAEGGSEPVSIPSQVLTPAERGHSLYEYSSRLASVKVLSHFKLFYVQQVNAVI